MNKERVYSLFEFLEASKGEKIPFVVKLLVYPERVTTEDLNVKGNVELQSTSIKFLPVGLIVEGHLYLMNTQLSSLPDGLVVGRILGLSGSKINSIPNKLNVGKGLFLISTPLSEKYTKEQIRTMIEEKGGKIGGEIYNEETTI